MTEEIIKGAFNAVFLLKYIHPSKLIIPCPAGRYQGLS